MPFALLTEFVSEKRDLLVLTIYLLSHVVNQGGSDGLGGFCLFGRIDNRLDVGVVDVIFAVI